MSETGFPDAAHFRKLENMYHAAPCNAAYQPTLRVAEGQTELVFEVKPAFHHAAGAAHGSVYFKALDAFIVTSTFTVYLLRPVASGQLRAEGRVVSHARTQLLAEAAAFDEAGRQVARGSGVFVKTRQPLTEALGYR